LAKPLNTCICQHLWDVVMLLMVVAYGKYPAETRKKKRKKFRSAAAVVDMA